MKQTSEAAFEAAIEMVLLADGYHQLSSGGFDRERAIFPEVALDFIRDTQDTIWKKLQTLPRRADRRSGVGGALQVAGQSRGAGDPAPWL